VSAEEPKKNRGMDKPRKWVARILFIANDDHRSMLSPTLSHTRRFHPLVQQPVKQGFTLGIRLPPCTKMGVAGFPFRVIARRAPSRDILP
jgi:hypothetical protein